MIRKLLLLLLAGAIPLVAQISFKNQLHFTRWNEYHRDILEDWSDVTYQRSWLQLGIRYEINHPPDPFIFPRDSLLKKYELTYRYVQFNYKRVTATVGTFYEMFGRGLTLRTYEDRNLRVDTNLDGLKFNFSGRRFKLKALAGRMRDKYNRRKDTLYGFDSEGKPLKNVHLGASFLYQDSPGRKNTHMWSGRFSYNREAWDFYAEMVRPDWYDAFSYYTAFNWAGDEVAVTLEYKDYNHMSFKTIYGTEYNAAPSLTREHVFSLLNRHPHALNQNDEKGYQMEVTYTPSLSMEFLFNHSQTFTHANQRIFQEFYGQFHHYFSESMEYYLAMAWNYDFTTNTENLTPLADGTIDFTERDQLHLSLQHQHTKSRFDQSEYDNEFALIEYSRSPYISLAAVGEYTNKYKLNNIQMRRHTWLYGMVSFNFWRNQRLSFLYGSRREGFVCVGGICRYEPEFEGIEIKLTNRF